MVNEAIQWIFAQARARIHSFLKSNLQYLYASRILTETRLFREDPVTQLIVLSLFILIGFTIISTVMRASKKVWKVGTLLLQLAVVGVALWISMHYREQVMSVANSYLGKLDL